MNFYGLSGLVNGITATLLGLFVYFKNRRETVNRSFGLFGLSVAVWGYSYFLYQMVTNKIAALFWCRALMAGAIFIPACFLYFVLSLLNILQEKKRILISAYLFSFIFLVLDFTPLFVKDVSPRLSFPYWPEAGITFIPFLLMFFGYVVYAWYLMYKECQTTEGIKRNQIKYVLIGTVIGFLGGSTNYPLWYGIPIYPFGTCLISVLWIIIAYTIIKHKLMDITIVLGRGMVYTTFLVVIAGGYLGLSLGLNKFFPGLSQNLLAQVVLTFLAIGAFAYFQPKVRAGAEKTILKSRYEHLNSLRNLAKRLGFIPKEEELLNQAVENIASAMKIPKVSVILLDEVLGDYIPQAYFGLSEDQTKEIILSANKGIIAWLVKNKRIFIREEMERILSPEEMDGINKDLAELEPAVCLPLFVKNRLLGILTLSNKTSGEMFSHLDLDVLETLTNQLALILSYRKLEKQMLQADKLASLGTLALGMAHEIKNPLSSINIFAQLLPEKFNDTKFLKEYSKIVIHDSERITKIIDMVMDLAQSTPPEFSILDPGEILDNALVSVESNIKENRIHVIREYHRVSKIMGGREQFQQVFSNILLHASSMLKEIKRKRQIKIQIDLKPAPLVLLEKGIKKCVVVEIKDNGPGMKKDILDQLFDPFFTIRRATESGLGLALSHHIIKEYKGTIEVSSRVGKGTTFSVNLPAYSKG